jgi:hypothetical protein
MKLKMGTYLALCAVGVAALGLFDCGSSSKGTSSGYTIANCPNSTLPAACVSCLTGSCSAFVTNFDSACSDFLACACPLGEDAGVCYPSTTCQAAPTSTPCSSCATVCPSGLGAALNGFSSSGGGPSGGSGSGSGSSGGGSSSGDAGASSSSSGGSSGSSGSSGTGSSSSGSGSSGSPGSDSGAVDAAGDAPLIILSGV